MTTPDKGESLSEKKEEEQTPQLTIKVEDPVKIENDQSPNTPKNFRGIGEYLFGEQLGEGGYSVVHEGINKRKLKRVAIKTISTNKEYERERLKSEIIQKKLNHENIVKLFEVIYDDNTAYLIMEIVPGGSIDDLFKRVEKNKPKKLRIEEIWYFTKQLFSGLDYLHSKSIVHRDIKPSNVLITTSRMIKISDFGECAEISPFEEVSDSPSRGTHIFKSPQVAAGKKADEIMSDIWAGGVCLYLMLTNGEYPFGIKKNEKILDIFRKIEIAELVVPKGVKDKDLIDLLKGILEKEEGNRFTTKKILGHDWFVKKEKKYMEKILKLNEKEIIIDKYAEFSIIPIIKKHLRKVSRLKKEEKRRKKEEKEKEMEEKKEKEAKEKKEEEKVEEKGEEKVVEKVEKVEEKVEKVEEKVEEKEVEKVEGKKEEIVESKIEEN